MRSSGVGVGDSDGDGLGAGDFGAFGRAIACVAGGPTAVTAVTAYLVRRLAPLAHLGL
jgi:hypothetical protein